eukprot:1636573-Heterocapsa_arctica.AAC.1
MIEDDEEDHEEVETKATGPQTFDMTEAAVKEMAMIVTQGILDKMKTMEEKMELNTTHDATKQAMIVCFADTERSLEAAHDYNKEHFRLLEGDIRGVKRAVKDIDHKRKSNEMDEDNVREEEDNPSDTEDDE